MKPRPTFTTLVIPPRFGGLNISIECRRNGHIRTNALPLASQCRNYWAWRTIGGREGIGNTQWEGCGRRHASKAAAAAPGKTKHGTVKAPAPTLRKNNPSGTTKAVSKPKSKTVPQSWLPPTTVPTKTALSNRTTSPILRAKESLNPPDFTYAPELIVPARKAGQNFASYLWGAGRAYVNFYKQGISNVRQTRKLAKELNQKDKAHVGQSILTRAEWQIVRRSKRDMLRLPVFGLLVLCLGEWLALVALYLTPVIPEPCHIPQQVNRTLRKLEDKRAERLRQLNLDAARLKAKDPRPANSSMDTALHELQTTSKLSPTAALIKHADLEQMTLFELSHFSAVHDCHQRLWDWLSLTPPKVWLQSGVKPKLEYLLKDNRLIERDGGWAALGAQEVKRACVERGIAVREKGEAEIRRALVEQWGGVKWMG